MAKYKLSKRKLNINVTKTVFYFYKYYSNKLLEINYLNTFLYSCKRPKKKKKILCFFLKDKYWMEQEQSHFGCIIGKCEKIYIFLFKNTHINQYKIVYIYKIAIVTIFSLIVRVYLNTVYFVEN